MLMEKSVQKIFSDNLRALRVKRKMTRSDLAGALDVDNSQVYNWESGKSFATAPNIDKLCKILKVSHDRLFAS